jgi:hypothetical protein
MRFGVKRKNACGQVAPDRRQAKAPPLFADLRNIDGCVTHLTLAVAARRYPPVHTAARGAPGLREKTMRWVVEKPILKAFAVVVACAALVVAMQVHLWQARAVSAQATPAVGMSSFINDQNFTDYPKPLPIIGEPI